MQSESRRAFLKGRRPPVTPWEAFCNRLRRLVAGTLAVLADEPGRQAARLTVRQPADAHHARVLCAEYGVCMALDDVPTPALHDGPVLWLRPGREISAHQRLEPGGSRWFVQPGCLLGELEAVGFTCFAGLPAHLTVAAWLADRASCNWPTGHTAASGLVHATALLGDGTSVGLGEFGTDNRKALDSLRLQQLIPSLFSLSMGDDARLCAEWRAWPSRYRLDALQPAAGNTLNLSHLLLGHGGDLAWVEWVVLDEQLADAAAGQQLPLELPGVGAEGDAGSGNGPAQGGSGPCEAVNAARAAQDIDAAMKNLFDPNGVFPHPGQAL
ncbi:MAG: hypothetical protein GX772_04120 [Alcaligenaceae bacterium]|nr:hypothetical protein [Alcaligenaceae bacterium]